MYKKLMVTTAIALFCQVSTAETCPSISDIKKHALHGWQAYDSDDATRLTPKRKRQFEHNMEQFALAEWTDKDHKNGAIHCYYHDKNGSALGAYLAKENFIPENAEHVWYPVSGFMHCAAGEDKCAFQQKTSQQQFAKK